MRIYLADRRLMPLNASQLFRKSFVMTLGASLALTAVAIIYFSRWVIVGTLIGMGIGALASPLLNYLHRKLQIPRGLGAVLFILLLMAAMGSVGWILVDLTSSELVPLIGEFPKLLTEARSRMMNIFGRFQWFRNSLESVDLGSATQSAIQAIYQGLQLGTVAIAGLFFSIFIALYFASDPGAYERAFLSLFPAHRRVAMRGLFRMSARSLRQWFYAQLIAMSIVGLMTGVGLWIIGVPYAAGFGLLTAALDIIPYIGPMIAFIAVGIITLASDPGNLVWVALVFIVLQQFEGDVVVPLAMKAGVQLPPIHLMVLMLVMAQGFGILGILIAPPLLAIGRSIYLVTHVRNMDARITREEHRKAG